MTKPLLVVFLGFPGSGKTYFSRNLAEKYFIQEAEVFNRE